MADVREFLQLHPHATPDQRKLVRKVAKMFDRHEALTDQLADDDMRILQFSVVVDDVNKRCLTLFFNEETIQIANRHRGYAALTSKPRPVLKSIEFFFDSRLPMVAQDLVNSEQIRMLEWRTFTNRNPTQARTDLERERFLRKAEMMLIEQSARHGIVYDNILVDDPQVEHDQSVDARSHHLFTRLRSELIHFFRVEGNTMDAPQRPGHGTYLLHAYPDHPETYVAALNHAVPKERCQVWLWQMRSRQLLFQGLDTLVLVVSFPNISTAAYLVKAIINADQVMRILYEIHHCKTPEEYFDRLTPQERDSVIASQTSPLQDLLQDANAAQLVIETIARAGH